MSHEVFSRTESVFFVCDGIEKAGGCTLQYILDNGGFANFDKSKIMDGAGEPIAIGLSATYEDATGIITEGTPGDFDDAEVGMVIYIEQDGSGSFDEPGRYEITAISAGTITIELNLNGDNDTTVDVNIGGSFDKLQNAFEYTTASDGDGYHDCYLFINTDESGEDPTPAIYGGGDIANNTKLFITGFHTTLLDMFPGGTYYQSCYDAWYLGIDADCHIEIDLDDVDDFLFSTENTVIRNLRIRNNSSTSTAVLRFAENSSGHVFRNCIIDDGGKVILADEANRSLIFIDCYIANGTNNVVRAEGENSNLHFINCVIDNEANNTPIMQLMGGDDNTCTVSGCLIIPGKWVFSGNSHIIEWNNTVLGYSANFDGLHRMSSLGIRICFDDIVILPQAAEIINIVQNGGSVLYADRLCLWGSDDAEYTGNYGWNTKSGGSAGRRDFNTIDVDPDFNSSYRPRNPQVLRGGSAMLSDGRSQLGAIKQKYQFPQKGRAVNHGRLGILK